MNKLYIKIFVIVIFIIIFYIAILKIKKSITIIGQNKSIMEYNKFLKEKIDIRFWLKRKYKDNDFLFFEVTNIKSYDNLKDLLDYINLLKNKKEEIEYLDLDKNIKEFYRGDLEYFKKDNTIKHDDSDKQIHYDLKMAPGYLSSNLSFSEIFKNLGIINYGVFEIKGIKIDENEYSLESSIVDKYGVLLFEKNTYDYESYSILVELLKSFKMKNIIGN